MRPLSHVRTIRYAYIDISSGLHYFTLHTREHNISLGNVGIDFQCGDRFGNIAVRLFEVGPVIFEKNAIIQEPKNNIASWEDSAKAFHKNVQKMIS